LLQESEILLLDIGRLRRAIDTPKEDQRGVPMWESSGTLEEQKRLERDTNYKKDHEGGWGAAMHGGGVHPRGLRWLWALVRPVAGG
jgi:hypothetical protein